MRKPQEIPHAFSPTDSLTGATSFYLLGIGGAGMSALARMLKHRGFAVRGRDSTESPETHRLVKEGISVRLGQGEDELEAGVAVIVSDAIDLDTSPEISWARTNSAPMVRRSQALGWLLRDRKLIAVTGTHGKTTTTGMIGSALIALGLDPLVVVGAAIPQWGGPVREGNGEWAVVEACEAYDSFHDLNPSVVVLTNLEADHLDFHGTLAGLKASVTRFVNSLPPDGLLIYCLEDPGSAELGAAYRGPKRGYALPESLADDLTLPGWHNQLNMQAAIALVQSLDLDVKVAEDAVRKFSGAERRLQILRASGPTLLDDYAHHPTEIRASLEAVRSRYFGHGTRHGRLIVVFQPHLYSRTAEHLIEFSAALSLADHVVLTDIYPAREAPMPGISSARIAEKLSVPVQYIPSRHLLAREVARLVQPNDVVVGMGAGNISEFGPALLEELKVRGQLLNRESRQALPKLKITVLYAGDSTEREVSLHSGRAIHSALQRLGHASSLVDASDLLLSKGDLSAFVGPNRPDLVFLGVHGTNAEDGAIQGLLELLHIPYTGSGIQASAIAMDKAMTKRILDQHQIPTPKGYLLNSIDDHFGLTPPLIVKPNAQGSTVGLTFVENQAQLCPGLLRGFAYGSQVLVEEWVKGTEISTPVLNGKALLPVEIAPVSGQYDFANKYTPGATQEIVPARLDPSILLKAQDIALRAHRALGCAGATRTDAIVRDGEIIVLEVNTLPGMTGTSLLPNSAQASGISFDELCHRLVYDAVSRAYPEKYAS